MKNHGMTRVRPLLIWTILQKDTDTETPIDTQTLLSALEQMGVSCERRALERDLDAMIQAGFPIQKRQSKPYAYFVKHNFDYGEIDILLDCIQSATFLTENQTWDFMQRLTRLGGGGREKINSRTDNILLYSVHKTLNSEVKTSVSTIAEALSKNKKICFFYFYLNESYERIFQKNNIGENKKYIVSPQAKTIYNGFYYLLAKTSSHNNLVVYRIDRMSQVQIIDEPSATSEQADLENYKKHMFEMYGGEEIPVTLRISKNFVRTVYDFFSPEEIKLQKTDPEHYTFTCSIIKSPMFIAWCCSYGDNIKVLYPSSLVEEIRNYIHTLSRIYPEA